MGMNLPKEGWKEIGVIDLGLPCGNCELCGANLRYMHKVVHREKNLMLDIGVECASKIISGEDLDYIKSTDKAVRREAEHQKKELADYNAYVERCKKCNVEPLTLEQIRENRRQYLAKKEAEKKTKRKGEQHGSKLRGVRPQQARIHRSRAEGVHQIERREGPQAR